MATTKHFGNGVRREFAIPYTPSLDATAEVDGNSATIEDQTPTSVIFEEAPGAGKEIVIEHTAEGIEMSFEDIWGGGDGEPVPSPFDGFDPSTAHENAVLEDDNFTLSAGENTGTQINARSVAEIVGPGEGADPVVYAVEFDVVNFVGTSGSRYLLVGVASPNRYEDNYTPPNAGGGAGSAFVFRMVPDSARLYYGDQTGFTLVNNVTPAAGDKLALVVTLSALSGGAWPIKVEWYHNGNKITETTTSLAEADSLLAFAGVSNANGSSSPKVTIVTDPAAMTHADAYGEGVLGWPTPPSE